MESGNPFRLIDVLRKHSVPAVVIGGHAVTYHGYVRATEDTDVVFRRSPLTETSLLAALTEVNARWVGDDIDPDTGIERVVPVTAGYIRATHLMMLVTDYGFLDIFDFIPGHPDVSIDDLFDTAVEHEGIRFASLEWLRKMKSSANRDKDRLDLENLPEKD